MLRKCFFLSLLLFLSFEFTCAREGSSIFREYSYTVRFDEIDPGATSPKPKGWPRRIERILEDVVLENAVGAELCVEYWGGHLGTSEQKFKVNNNDWIYIPQPLNTPANPAFYHRTLLGNPPVKIPLEQLIDGKNTFVFTCGPQIKYFQYDRNSPNWGVKSQEKYNNFGFFWIYSFTLKVFYNESVPHPTGEIVFPHPGAFLGDSPVIVATAHSEDDSIKKVEFIGYYDDYDWEGNGVFKDWHYQYRKGKIMQHLGTAVIDYKIDYDGGPGDVLFDESKTVWIQKYLADIKDGPYVIMWNNIWVPDQESNVKIRARITDHKGMVYLTPAVENISVVRPDRSVKMFKSTDVPEAFGSRGSIIKECTINVPGELNNVLSARLAISTWSGVELSEIGLNGKKIAGELGRVVDYGYDFIPVSVNIIKSGINIFYALSLAYYHTAEINWPGPALLVNYIIENNYKGKKLLTETMISGLQNEHWQVRAYAVENLGKMEISSAMKLLIARLKDERWQVRLSAIKALGELGDAGAINPLLDVLRAEKIGTVPGLPAWRIRKSAAESLAQMKGPKAQALLTIKEPPLFT